MNVQTFSSTARSLARAPMEHRWGERVALDHPVTLGDENARNCTGRLVNASVSGALIETNVRLAPLTALRVTIYPPGADTLTLVACVVRCEPGAIGVEWRDMACPPLIEMLRAADVEARLCARD